MKRIVAVACLLTCPAIGLAADEIGSKRAAHEVSADTDPNSVFWQGVPAILAGRDRSGNPVPGHQTEIRSRWTAGNLYFLFICPYDQLNLKPQPKTDAETNELWK